MYKLKEPTKSPLSDRLPFYLFAGLLTCFMLWIVLIRPMTLPADQMPFIFEYDPVTKEVYPEAQKRTYFLLTGGAILGAIALTIPTIRNSRRFDYTLEKIYANREYMTVEEHGELCNMLNHNTFRPNNAPEVQEKLQAVIDSHKGKHVTGRLYFKKEYWQDLPKSS